MAKYIKNETNFHGARSKTRVVESSSTKSKKNDSKDDGWGSIPNSSRNNSSWDDDTWSTAPNNPSVEEGAWGQERLVSGKSERNRKFRTFNENSTFRVPIQSRPNWEEVDNEFPSLGSQRPSVPNVWEKRKQKFEEVAAIEPTSLSEEEMMIQRALELSKMETRQEEERKRQLEEEYRLQTQLLEANPDMFDEFRPGTEDLAAPKSCHDYPKLISSDEFVDAEDDWQYSTSKTTQEKVKEKNEHPHPREDEGWRQSKQSSGLPSFGGNTPKSKSEHVRIPPENISSTDSLDTEDDWKYSATKTIKEKAKPNSGLPSFSGNTTAKPKVPKVVEMFGGWGHSKKPFTQDIVEAKPSSKSNKWDTVDANFVTRPTKKSETGDQFVCQPSTPAALEVKLENTSNWDAIDTIDLTTAIKEPEKRNYLGTRDAVELNLKDCEPGYSLDQKEQEFSIQSKKKQSKATVGRHIEVNENTAIPTNEWYKTDACFEQETDLKWKESCGEITSEIGKQGDQLSNSEQFVSDERNVRPKIEESNAGAKIEESNAGAKIEESNAGAKIEESNAGAKIEESNAGAKIEESNAGAKIEESNADTKIEVASLEDKKSDLQKTIESDYDILLSRHITGSQSKDSNQRYTIPVEEKSDIFQMYSLPESQATNQTLDYFLSDLTSQEGATIPEPKPIKNETYYSSNRQLDSSNNGQCNTNDINPFYSSEPDYHLPLKMSRTILNAQPLSTFGGYPTNVEDHHLPVGNENMGRNKPPNVSTPEFMNPAFLPQPMMTPMMNPALMMGMNPMLMQQQMMMLSNPSFFLQQLQQMNMYYKALGMPLATGMPTIPQPMAMPALHNPNLQSFGNPMSCVGSPTLENGMIPPFMQTPETQFPGPETSDMIPKTTTKEEQSDADSFWFQDFLSAEASPSFIPPPQPTPVDAPTNTNVLPEAFASLSLNAPNTSNDGVPDNGNGPDPPFHDSSSRTVVPGWEGGWGDLDMGSTNSDAASGWDDDNANGCGNNAKSMRNSSRYVPENNAASRPYLGRHKN